MMRHQSAETYANQLYGCRHELDILREQAEDTGAKLRPGETSSRV